MQRVPSTVFWMDLNPFNHRLMRGLSRKAFEEEVMKYRVFMKARLGMCVPGQNFLQARQGVSTGGQTNQGLSTPVERLLRSPSRRTVSAGSPSETSSRRTASAGSSPGNPFRRTVSAGSPPEISSRRTLSAGSSPGSRFRRTVSAGNPSQDIHSMPAKECAARLMCSAAGTSGLKVCILQETPPCGPGEICAQGRAYPGEEPLAGRQ